MWSQWEDTQLSTARQACKQVIQNLRKDDYFSLVIFDDVADVVVPHGRFGNYNNEDLLERISRIHSRGCTNLTGGWEAAQSEIKTHLLEFLAAYFS